MVINLGRDAGTELSEAPATRYRGEKQLMASGNPLNNP